MKREFRTNSNMRKLFIATVISILFSQANFAQEKGTHELKVHAGVGTSNTTIDFITDVLTYPATLGQVIVKNSTTNPAFGITYKYAIKDRWMLFTEGNYQSTNKDIFFKQNQTAAAAKSEKRYITAGIGSDYYFLSKDIVQLYSGASVAYTFTSESFSNNTAGFKSDSSNYFNFHINAIGLRVGKKLAASIELGFGYKGIANAGISYQF
ncbi:outer membrane beta-barrel protein [Tenacibaculum maritimum]|uniref:outer membrane beta-barrel protein n=1 Tax=Tenacibaculum maritimum TaxID=107401 RepID=UPI0010A454C3|nr:outer membrane beta-barrel protein [Tenacibaculum maritimum]QCD63296.1 hypothetical protein B9C57_12535 [Tenacibaculum maritimum]CAA0148591.1 conserved exported hypothetical protein [Tenacibaculum maritimum]CAA0150154.1 conserved exported hypothetical protein [Tenacibaculum maritimum]CAA0151177.1 conserved exported hypothetical protein [Tenacibaculum maritimum]CAA0151367.1 conserved exported hypothetical protein [Tenacibaculum maritimum]